MSKIAHDNDQACLFVENREIGASERLAMLKSRAKMESGKGVYLHILQLFVFLVVIVSFTWVFYRIAVLSFEVDSLNRRYEVLSNRPLQPADAMSRTSWNGGSGFRHHERCNCTFEQRHQRSRRSPSETDGETDVNNDDSNAVEVKMPQHFARHLVPKEGDAVLKRGEMLKWKDVENPSNPYLRNPSLDLLVDRYLMAPIAGFYFAYSQVTYNDALTRTVGHMMTTRGRCGHGPETILLSSEITQQRRRHSDLGINPRDSSYTGGVVYLSAGDLIAVLPKLDITTSLNVSQTTDNTFFGAFLVSADENAISLLDACQ